MIMDVKDKVFCLYSDMVPWIDGLFVCSESECENAKKVVEQAYDDWHEEDDPDEAIGDYIRRRLNENGMEGVEIYWKQMEE